MGVLLDMKMNCRVVMLLIAIQGAGVLLTIMNVTYFDLWKDPDSRGYHQYFNTGKSGKEHYTALLTGSRTPGYPIMLKAAQVIDPGLKQLPSMQYLLHVTAVMIFAACLMKLGFSGLLSLAAASPLIYGNFALGYCSHMLADSPALSLALVSAGLFFLFLSNPDKILFSIMLGAIVFLTIITRPAYLFLVPLYPFLTLLLQGFTDSDARVKWNRRILSSLKCLTAIMIPLLLWCSLRLMMVGHFGIVSFSGKNLIGIAGQLATIDMVDKLSPEYRTFAKNISIARIALKTDNGFQEYKPGANYYAAFTNNFNPTAHRIVPLALQYSFHYEDRDFSEWKDRIFPDDDPKHIDDIEWDRFQAAFSREVIAVKMRDYLGIVEDNFFCGIKDQLGVAVGERFSVKLMLMLGLCGLVLIVTFKHKITVRAELSKMILFMLVFSTVFLCSSLLAVSLVEATIERYTRPAAFFIQSPFVLIILLPWVICYDNWRQRRTSR